jgi:hypothetical protein
MLQAIQIAEEEEREKERLRQELIEFQRQQQLKEEEVCIHFF